MPDRPCLKRLNKPADYTLKPLFGKEVLELLAQDLPDLGGGRVEQQAPREFLRLVGH
jgi:hypothetical protein